MEKIDEYNFKKFSGFNTRNNLPTVSVTKAEAIGLSVAFCNENNVDQYRYAVLYYDDRKNSIGFKLTNDEDEESKFAVTRTNKNKGKSSSIVAHTFFAKNRIPVSRYAHKYIPKKFNLEEINLKEEGHMFVIDLKEEQPNLE